MQQVVLPLLNSLPFIIFYTHICIDINRQVYRIKDHTLLKQANHHIFTNHFYFLCHNLSFMKLQPPHFPVFSHDSPYLNKNVPTSPTDTPNAAQISVISIYRKALLLIISFKFLTNCPPELTRAITSSIFSQAGRFYCLSRQFVYS